MTAVERIAPWSSPNHNPPETCTVDGCDGEHVARGYCRMHYTRYNRGKPIGTADPQRDPTRRCLVESCDRLARMWGYCPMHGQRFRKYGDPEALGWGTLSEDSTHYLYRLWAADGSLLYVGVTCDPVRRFKQHSAVQSWWPGVAGCTVERHSTRSAVIDAERVAVADEMPLYNIKLAKRQR